MFLCALRKLFASFTVGYKMPVAIGATLAFPKKMLVRALELETAVRCHIPIICLVLNNNMYGIVRMHHEIHD